jgi:hypothetical protein
LVGRACRCYGVRRGIPRRPCDELEERQREKREDARGLFKGGINLQEGLGLGEIGRRGGMSCSGWREELEEGDDRRARTVSGWGRSDVRGPCVSRKRRGLRIPFRDLSLLGLGPHAGLGQIGPPGLLFLFYFFFLFF